MKSVHNSRETKVLCLHFLKMTSLLPTCSLQDEASSESVKNRTKIDEHTSRSVIDNETKPATAATSITGRKDVFDLEDLANLVCLALSDYAIWADVDLRRKIDWGNNQDYYGDDTDKSIDDNNGCTFSHIESKILKSTSQDILPAYIMRHSEVC